MSISHPILSVPARAFTRGAAAVRRGVRIARALATDKRLPRWLRLLFAVGMVQIPVLPTDEIALALALAIVMLRYRRTVADIIREA